ncbi:MAG: PSD1 and planctomycete cytochrome C domain-containing protein [Pirellulaceae bacterium]
MLHFRWIAAGLVCCGLLTASAAAADDAAGIEFFEKQVRPILVARCYECHGGQSKRLEGGLRLDSLAAAMKGGDTGPAVVPGKPDESLLVDAVNYGDLYQMPPKTRLPEGEVAALTKWVEMGAPWPQEEVNLAAGSPDAFNLAQRRAEHWCWQPLANPPVPTPRAPHSAPRNPIDAFILAKLQESKLSPAPPADPRTLIRRASFDLIGLPPTPDEVGQFVKACANEESPGKAFEQVVDKLLASPHFGERWGRHWLDLVRYAESRGHEFDYNIPNAFEYRDYVIRALNEDVPYDQFVIEHVAGDLLDQPRLHPVEGWNESIVATGFWFLGEGLHSPVDIRKDECDRIDNQIDVLSKTFLGLTVSCARCHDHKFDAISQRDYYALAGYLQSSSYRLARFETWQQDRELLTALDALDKKYQPLVAAAAADAIRPLVEDLAGRLEKRLAGDLSALRDELGMPALDLKGGKIVVDYGNLSAGQWLADGPAFGSGPVAAGTVVRSALSGGPEIATVGAARSTPAAAELGIAAGVEQDQARLAGWTRAGRTLKTPTWTIQSGQVHSLIEGAGHVYAAVDSHLLINGPLHGELVRETGGNIDLPTRWITQDLSRYVGHRVHLELSPKAGEEFRVLMVVDGAQKPAPLANSANGLLPPGATAAACRELIETTLDLLAKNAILRDKLAGERAALANWLIAEAKLAEHPSQTLTDWIAAREQEISRGDRQSRLCMAMWDGTPVDEHLLIRGNHKTVGPAIPRRMLEAVQGSEVRSQGPGGRSQESGSGRLELARQLVDSANPLTSRVMVNRVWHHLLGRGLVTSVDNFGVLGEEPTHPALLDHLARQFIDDGWSVKRLIRSIVLSQTYSQESGVRDQGSEIDPQNLLFHRQNLRRLEGEAIRDAILAISGRLDRKQFGPSVPVHLTPFMQGRGRPGESGPFDGAGRRSIYISVRRNFLSPMMLAFDTPTPASTVGRRNVSNVPAQALILMNDPFVAEQARLWADNILADKDASPDDRIRRMYQEALCREPTAEETAAARSFVELQAGEYGLSAEAPPTDERVWADLGHVVYNVKEFVFLH